MLRLVGHNYRRAIVKALMWGSYIIGFLLMKFGPAGLPILGFMLVLIGGATMWWRILEHFFGEI